MYVRLIYLLLDLKIFIQIAAIILPPKIVKVLESIVDTRVRTYWHLFAIFYALYYLTVVLYVA